MRGVPRPEAEAALSACQVGWCTELFVYDLRRVEN